MHSEALACHDINIKGFHPASLFNIGLTRHTTRYRHNIAMMKPSKTQHDLG